MLTNFSLSGQTTFTINSETISNVKIVNQPIYSVSTKEIEYYPFVKGKVETYSYREFLKKKKNLEKAYNDFISNSEKEGKTLLSMEAYDYELWVEMEKGFTESDKYEDGYVKSDNKSKRIEYMVDKSNTINDLSEIMGQYQEISSSMVIANENVEDRFLVNELSYDVRKYYRYRNENYTTLIKNLETGKLYAISYKTFQEIQNIKENKKIEAYIRLLGYQSFYVNGNLYLKTKHYRILCNQSTYNVLQNDKEYLKKVDSWYEQRETIRKQIISTTPKFDHYARLYRVQRNRMSKVDISSWTALTKSANLLNKKEVDLTDKLWGLLELQNATENYHKYSSEFIDYLSASTGVLGI